MGTQKASQTCPQCEQTFAPYNNRTTQRFCSYACQRLWYIKEQKLARDMARQQVSVSCYNCGNEITGAIVGQKYCSESCRDQAKRACRISTHSAIECGVCKKEFTPIDRRSKYCSPTCRKEAVYQRGRAKRARLKEHNNSYQREYRQRNNKAVRKHRLKTWYGISLEEFDSLLKAQNHRCAICGASLDGGKETHLDHSHKTQSIRGILCNNCNTGIGMFKDDPLLLHAAADYLERHQ